MISLYPRISTESFLTGSLPPVKRVYNNKRHCKHTVSKPMEGVYASMLENQFSDSNSFSFF